MKAIVKLKPERGLWMQDMPMPTYGDNDVLIKIEKTSICGTDLHLYEWDEWASKTLPVPSIIGHEFYGRVEAWGKNVTGFKKGDRVSGEGHITCGQCYQCRTGNQVLCPHTIGVGVNRHGCFAQYLTIPAQNVFPLPDNIGDDTASLFDPFGNAVHTALSFDLVGKDVLITGAGPIGLMAIGVAKLAGARNVVISDLNPYRLDLAKKLNATRAINVKEQKISSVYKELGIDGGFDVCLEMSGSPKAFAEIPELLKTGGKIALLGILPSHATINWHDVIFKMITIKGIYGREIFRTWYQACHLLQSGLDLSKVITHRFAADDFQKGFDAMLSGNAGKVVLDWT
jgi:threonine 3-dehydrogenase